MEPLIIIAGILVIGGIIGSIIPALPGPILGFSGLVILHFMRGNETISTTSLLGFGIAMSLLFLLGYLAPIWGAKFSGATKQGLWGSAIGAFIGILFFPPLGLFIGAFIGAIIGELSTGKEITLALKAGIGTLLGSVSVVILQTLFSLIVAGYFFWKLF